MLKTKPWGIFLIRILKERDHMAIKIPAWKKRAEIRAEILFRQAQQEHDSARAWFTASINSKALDFGMPICHCADCGKELLFSGFFIRNAPTWKGTCKELKDLWLEWCNTELQTRLKFKKCSTGILCCSCYMKTKYEVEMYKITKQINETFETMKRDLIKPTDE